MDRNTLITFTVDKWFEDTFKNKPDVVRFLQGHTKKPQLIENLNQEIRVCELNPNIKMETEDVMSVAMDFAQSFSRVALNVKEQEINDEHIREAKIAHDKKRRFEEFVTQASIEDFMESKDVKEVTRDI